MSYKEGMELPYDYREATWAEACSNSLVLNSRVSCKVCCKSR